MEYEEFRKRISHKIVEKLDWKDLATFVPNKKLPTYNWFYYKEGFAKEMVENLIKMFGIEKGDTILDPFCGSGTTLLAAKQNGINSIGYDVLPISVFASRVKTADHDVDKIREAARYITRQDFVELITKGKFPSIFYNAFSKYALQDIAFIRHEIMKIDPQVREFFVLALINTALKCSYAYKDGSVIKIRRKPVPPMRKMFARILLKMIKDVEKTQMPKTDVTVELNDARVLPLDDESVDAVITSPPYLNNIDYTKVYSIEEFFIYGEPISGVRAYIGLKPKESDFLSEIDLPIQARLYFEDMNTTLSEIYRVLKNGKKAAIVVGNGYVNEIIESDIILSYLAEKIGFEVENILVLNTRFALEQRTIKKGVLRESLIILKK